MGKFHCNILDIIHFILSFAWICICNENLLNYDLTTNDVSIDVNIDETIKLDFGYKKQLI
jgi:hypothetical protein